jgi:hypothetical protein
MSPVWLGTLRPDVPLSCAGRLPARRSSPLIVKTFIKEN